MGPDPDELKARRERDVAALLPLRARAEAAVLLEEVEPDFRRWRARARIPLRGR